MVPPADAPVEEKAVVVVVFDAQVTQLAVFSEVRRKQLRGNQTGRETVVRTNPTFLLHCLPFTKNVCIIS